MSKEKIRKFGRYVFTAIGIVGIIVVILMCVMHFSKLSDNNFSNWFSNVKLEDRGTLRVAILSAILAAFSVGGYILTFMYQRKTFEETKAQFAEQQNNATSLQKNAFDQVFFMLYGQYKKELSMLKRKGGAGGGCKRGPEVIDYLANLCVVPQSFGWFKTEQGGKIEGFDQFKEDNPSLFIADAHHVHLESAAHALYAICHQIKQATYLEEHVKRSKELLRDMLSKHERFIFGCYRYISYNMKGRSEKDNEMNVADEIFVSDNRRDYFRNEEWKKSLCGLNCCSAGHKKQSTVSGTLLEMLRCSRGI